MAKLRSRSAIERIDEAEPALAPAIASFTFLKDRLQLTTVLYDGNECFDDH